MKKQTLLILAVFTAVFSSLVSCKSSCEKGSGKPATEDRKVEAFTKIRVSGNYKLVLQQGPAAVKVTVDDNLQQLIKTTVSRDELSISTDGDICGDGQIIVNITNPNFEAVKSSGVIDLSAAGKLNLKDFDLELSGVSEVDLNLTAANVKTLANGRAEIDLTGQATSNTVTANGSATLNALDFTVANYKIDTRGAANCKINVLNELNINMTGAGTVEYKGNPAKINKENSVGTTVSKIQ